VSNEKDELAEFFYRRGGRRVPWASRPYLCFDGVVGNRVMTMHLTKRVAAMSKTDLFALFYGNEFIMAVFAVAVAGFLFWISTQVGS
jgi:hypothetical protein